jgi:hypothetical protein
MSARAVRNGHRVLVVSNRDDVHARAVLARLDAVSGVEGAGVLFDTATFPMATDISVQSPGPGTIAVQPALPRVFGGGTASALRQSNAIDRSAHALNELHAVYWRRPRASIVDEELTQPELRRYAARSSRETIEGMVEQLALDCRVVDPPSRVARAGLKVLQLNLAARAGLNVPRTLVTNDPAQAAAFIQDGVEGLIVAKSPADLPDFAAHTTCVHAADTGALRSIRLTPIILQERIVGGPDLRITVIGRRLFGCAQMPRVGFDDVDCRADPTPHLTAFDPPPELRDGILAMQASLGLAFGAFDFKCDRSGVPYFLEVNPMGQWLFVEVATCHPIAEALARYLWHGPGAEWGTTMPALRLDDLGPLCHDAISQEYAALRGQVASEVVP